MALSRGVKHTLIILGDDNGFGGWTSVWLQRGGAEQSREIGIAKVLVGHDCRELADVLC